MDSQAARKLPILLLLLCSVSLADYSDVLVIYNSQSQDSYQVAAYFASRRPGLTQILRVDMPQETPIKFDMLNRTLLQPLKKYLQSPQGASINYIVLTKGIPLWTNETEGWGGDCHSVECANSSSVDTEIMLLNGPYESFIGQSGAVPNPYYASNKRFSHQGFGIYLVGRLDAKTVKTVKHMVDSAASFTKKERDSGLHVLAKYGNIQSYPFAMANKTLFAQGLNILYDGEETSQLPSKLAEVSYLDAFGCYNFGDCDHGNPTLRNYTWKNGSLASSRFSWSARSTQDTDIGYVIEGKKYYYNNYLVSSYLAEGATAGLGYAVEPFASQVAVSQYVAESYVAGRNMGEILWSSIPTLSWAAVMFGDPKANYPTVGASIFPPYPSNSSPLSCNISIVDDLQRGQYDVKYQWSKNGEVQPSFSGSAENLPAGASLSAMLGADALSNGDSWQCAARLYQKGALLFRSNSSAVRIADLSSCGTVSSPGAHYLSSSLSINGSTCFEVDTDNVSIDCQGLQITGDNTSKTYAVHAQWKNVTIRNCKTSGFEKNILREKPKQSSASPPAQENISAPPLPPAPPGESNASADAGEENQSKPSAPPPASDAGSSSQLTDLDYPLGGATLLAILAACALIWITHKKQGK